MTEADPIEEGPPDLVARSTAGEDGAAHVDRPLDHRTSRDRTGDAAGTLVLIGGATTPTGAALGAFVSASGARAGAPIVVLTTASADPAGSAALWRQDLRDAGATQVEIPIVPDRHAACDTGVARLVRDAAGIFLGGGDQVHLIASVSGTPLGRALRDAYCGGATVGGTSAGAAALTETTLAYGEVDEEGKLLEMYIGPGLGLLGYRAMIDTHFGARRRLKRLFVAVSGNPELLGLGLDEDTALVVRGHMAEVVGVGGVTFVDARGTRYSNVGAVEKGRQITVSALRVGIIGEGHPFDLRARELVALAGPVERGAAMADGRTAADRR